MSIIWSTGQSGLDLLYPFSSLQKLKPGRLASLLLDHSKNVKLRQRDLHSATLRIEGVDPPRVAVTNLDDVEPKIIERRYTVPADFYGLVVMIQFLEMFITLLLHIFFPIDATSFGYWLGDWITYWFGDWFGGWVGYLAGVLFGVAANWIIGASLIIGLFFYAALRGDGVLTLVRRSDVSTLGHAILLDRDFTLVLIGSQSVVEAIAESSFNISHPISWSDHLGTWEMGQWFCYEALRGLCQGAPFAILAGFWLLLSPSSLFMAFIPLVPTVFFLLMASARPMYTVFRGVMRRQEIDVDTLFDALLMRPIRIVSGAALTFLLIFVYELVVAEDHVLRGLFHPTILFHAIPSALASILLISSRNYHIRTAKLLDIIGHPPVQRWEFDTLAAAATFQCLVLCHDLPRPVKSARIDILTLLDMLIPDQTDVWKAWKARVADRIAHETNISFASTLPLFPDHRQVKLTELLHQAQGGYHIYTTSYDRRVRQHTTNIFQAAT
ncbi:hypothetical protein JVU11DRAFT_9005 [Chiua virens]|nr:hypothetical protein JVU11DRAFT_9005 [Chiua virens]